MAPPFKEAEMVITSQGIDKEEGLVEAAINAGLLTKSGSFIKMGDKLLGQGKEQVKEVLSKDEKLRQHLTKEILSKIR